VPGFVAELEEAYRSIWRQWCAKAPPARMNTEKVAVVTEEAQETKETAERETTGRTGPAHGSAVRPARPPVVLCSGMPRSGSTWSYNVCRLLLESAWGTVRSGYHEGKVGDDYLSRAVESNGGDAAATNTAHVVKLHYPGPAALRLVREGRVRNVYTLRHPLDALASFREKFSEPLATAARRLRTSLDAARTWRERSDTLFVHFRDILAAPHGQIRRVAAYLGQEADDELIERIHAQTSVEAVREKTAQMAKAPQGLTQSNGWRFDPLTQYHVGHILKAGERDGRTELTEPEQAQAAEILGPWLSRWPELEAELTGAEPAAAPTAGGCR
jgi:hypothetical protein